MCLEWGQALCPGRTCGLGVFTLALFQAVSHTACWRLSLLDDSAQASSHKGGILRLRLHRQSCWFTVLADRRRQPCKSRVNNLWKQSILQWTGKGAIIEIHAMIVSPPKRNTFEILLYSNNVPLTHILFGSREWNQTWIQTLHACFFTDSPHSSHSPPWFQLWVNIRKLTPPQRLILNTGGSKVTVGVCTLKHTPVGGGLYARLDVSGNRRHCIRQ